MSTKKKKTFIALSGGVDSSVAALLLKNQGHDIVGVFMRCYNIDGTGTEDEKDARRVAAHLNIPFYVFDLEKEYKERVVKYMIDGYKKGITPNSDVMCNKEIKFGLFLEKALEMGATKIATGHYVQIKKPWRFNLQSWNSHHSHVSAEAPAKEDAFVDSHYTLAEGKDKSKDQSYFLWTLTQDQLQHCIFPIGKYKKSEVREIARKANLPTADKKDSQGICFLGKFSLRDFLKEHIPVKRGKVIDTEGNIIGTHDGVWFYTIGQRHGMSLRAKRSNLQGHYVVGKNITANTLTAAEGSDNSALYKDKVTVSSANITKRSKKTLVRTRYHGPLVTATLKKLSPDTFHLELHKPQKAIALGQSAVFYTKRGELIGGGVITNVS